MRFHRSRTGVVAALGATAVVLAACSSNGNGSGTTGGGGGGGGGTGGGAASGSVTIANTSGGLWTCGFNPFNPSVEGEAFGVIYEPLEYVDTLKSAKVTPWLATGSTWSKNNTVLTFTTRSGVKWSDGKPFSAADVAFTFNLLKKNKGLDLNSVWSVLSSVKQQGKNKVVFTFKKQAVPYFYYVADQVGIVPQHVWSTISNPVKYKDDKPVGTGPYTVGNCTGQNITYTANPTYWQKGLPKVKTVNYPAFTSNNPANNKLAAGQAQWGGQFIPNIDKFYASKSKDNHYWFPPTANVSLFINLTNPILKNVAVRKAMAYAIDRKKVSEVGEYGYEPPSNQTGIVRPTFDDWYDSSAASQAGYKYDPQKAEQILKSAGFTKGSDGVFQSPDGKKLSFSIINIGGFSDWVASLQVVTKNLKAAGIDASIKNMSSNAYDDALYNGKYDLAYASETGGPTPYYEFRQWLFSGNTAPIGQAASTNYERYKSPATDKLIAQYGATTDTKKQHDIVNKLQEVLLKDVPVIPVTESVNWFQYNTTHLSGWPTKSDPYALPAPYAVPDWEVVLLHLQPK